MEAAREPSQPRPRPIEAFGEDSLDADLASILHDRTGPRSITEWLNDWWHRPEIERIWQPPPSWRDDLKWYALAIIALQVVLALSLLLRDGSLSEDFGTIASMLGA